MSSSRIHVALGERSYPILIGPGFLDSIPEEFSNIFQHQKQVAIVTNNTVAPLYLERVKKSLSELSPSCEFLDIILPDGESFKNSSTLEKIYDALLEKALNRKCLMIALGGGVIGDMCGFAAATYQRGVSFFQVPTTLLSQVDSSVGGKTGINHPLGKNMIGAFYQPAGVLIDVDVLGTLPNRELSAGLAEVIKYGLISDYDFFCWIESNIEKLVGKDSESLTYAIKRSCEIKAEVVAADEKESGVRAILNLGHTYGHAIESHMGYGVWLHGEAVAAGMVMACELSCSLGWLEHSVVSRLTNLLNKASLPCTPPKEMKGNDFKKYMSIDKKNLDGSIRLVLLKGCGDAVITSDFDKDVFEHQMENL